MTKKFIEFVFAEIKLRKKHCCQVTYHLHVRRQTIYSASVMIMEYIFFLIHINFGYTGTCIVLEYVIKQWNPT